VLEERSGGWYVPGTKKRYSSAASAADARGVGDCTLK
jgi:hypothetical protein